MGGKGGKEAKLKGLWWLPAATRQHQAINHEQRAVKVGRAGQGRRHWCAVEHGHVTHEGSTTDPVDGSHSRAANERKDADAASVATAAHAKQWQGAVTSAGRVVVHKSRCCSRQRSHRFAFTLRQQPCCWADPGVCHVMACQLAADAQRSMACQLAVRSPAGSHVP